MRHRRDLEHRLERRLGQAADESLPRRDRARAARHAACLAERLGLLARPKACQWCRRRRMPLERHNPYHDEPLNIQFLCKTCHKLADSMHLRDN